MNGIPAGAVSSSCTPIHPDTQGLHYTLMGRDGKPIEGIWGRRGKQRMGAENHTDRQSAMMKRLPFLFLLSDQHVLPHPLQAPLRSTAMPGLADRPATLFRTLPVAAVSHGSMYRFASSHEELKQRWISLEGNRWEMCLNCGGMNFMIFLKLLKKKKFLNLKQICRWLQSGFAAVLRER